uniref:Uncharacterized protein n=1 Tax=Peronospora matthiolae TaxID=2874970 RepID=A0AAV1V8N1_9STRA
MRTLVKTDCARYRIQYGEAMESAVVSQLKFGIDHNDDHVVDTTSCLEKVEAVKNSHNSDLFCDCAKVVVSCTPLALCPDRTDPFGASETDLLQADNQLRRRWKSHSPALP